MIENERQYAITKRQLLKFQEAALIINRTKFNGLNDFLLMECNLNATKSLIKELQESLKEYDVRVDGDRKGNWFPTYSGIRFWPEDPKQEDISIIDVSRALANINRFCGHTREPYSVAQHSVLVSSILPPRLKLFGLLHDAGEAYLGDVITPIKRLLKPLYEPLEERIMEVVAKKFGFAGLFGMAEAIELVKQADMVLLATEIRDLAPTRFCNVELYELPMAEKIKPWSNKVAMKRFFKTFGVLYGETTE